MQISLSQLENYKCLNSIWKKKINVQWQISCGIVYNYVCPSKVQATLAHAYLNGFEKMAGPAVSRVKWLTDQEKTVIVSNFEKRGWVKGSFEGKEEK